MLRPLLLSPDNFTPAARTPWGGRRIVGRYKAGLGLRAELASAAIGESWELSLGPELPSRTDAGTLLAEVIAEDPTGFLGDEARLGSSALLVKWLDAADELSVQIHPAVDDPKLAPDETGKPESWYVLDAEPGAGIYLGLRPEVSHAQMRSVLDAHGDVSKLLERVPVTAGDFFVLEPGMPHAIGRGVTLLEPQYVTPGKRGVTLRYWDWNRRYDAAGKLDPNGSPRALHVDRALEVTDWVRAGDPAWLAEQRCSLGLPQLGAAATLDPICGPDGGDQVRSRYLRVARLAGHGILTLPDHQVLRALTVVSGSVRLHGEFGELLVVAGRSAAIPAGLTHVRCQLDAAHALLCGAVA
ncbi:MAG TPA: class I mannose-6-phosphate isomerase [Polyangiales bacterium]